MSEMTPPTTDREEGFSFAGLNVLVDSRLDPNAAAIVPNGEPLFYVAANDGAIRMYRNPHAVVVTVCEPSEPEDPA